MNNPERERFLHVNGIKYYTEDAIALDNGSIFIPISKEEIKNCEKKYENIFPYFSTYFLSDFLVYRLFAKNSMTIHLN